jgi:hypothetical protein
MATLHENDEEIESVLEEIAFKILVPIGNIACLMFLVGIVLQQLGW